VRGPKESSISSIDRTSKFTFAKLVATASASLVALIKAVPSRVQTILTDSGIQFRLPPHYADRPAARFVTTC
jgi:hypothetical protein